MLSLILAIIAALLLIALLFFITLADVALRAINPVRLRILLEEGLTHAEAVSRLLDRPHRITSTTMITKNVAIIALAFITVWIALDQSPPPTSPRRGMFIVLAGVVGIVVIVFTQLLARALALRNPERTAIRIIRPFMALYALISPVAWAADAVANGAVRLFGLRDEPLNPFITASDLEALVQTGQREGVIEEAESKMITGILRFGDRPVHEVMVPRPDVVAVSCDQSPREALEIALDAGHSRLPVYREHIDSIVGVVYTKDLVEAVLADRNVTLTALARPAMFIPEVKKLGELLRELQINKVHIAIVVDEYGGTAGVVTIEDLLEEIVGEIQDEYDVEPRNIEQVGPNEWIIQARTGLDEVNELLDLELNSEDFDSLGGLITSELERLPDPGDQVRVDGYLMTVLEIERHRIGRVRVQRLAEEESAEEEDD